MRAPSNIELRSVTGSGLRDVSVVFTSALLHALTGEGCSALLRVAGLLDEPLAGEVFVGGEGTRGLSSEERVRLRSRSFGFLFAAPYLLPSMTIVENVAVPYFKLAGAGLGDARERTEEVLAFAGVANRGCEPVGDLGWWDQQRVALARALVHRPGFLIVDHANAPGPGEEGMLFTALLREVPERFGAAVIVAVPAGFVAGRDERVLCVEGGAVRESAVYSSERESSTS